MPPLIQRVEPADRSGSAWRPLPAQEDAGPSRHRGFGLSAGAGTIAAVVLLGAGITTLAEHHRAMNPLDPMRSLSEGEVHDICAGQLEAMGIDGFTVPPFVPDARGHNSQAPRPWRLGATVKVVPHRDFRRSEGSRRLEPPPIVLCTITLD